MQVPLLDLKAQYAPLKEETMKAVSEVFDSQYFIMGPKVKEFEEAMEKYTGAKHALGVSSGTDALLLALMALGIGEGDEVITTPYTFFATAGSIARTGATPVFVDIDPITFNINANQIEAKVTEKTKAILPVHLYGQCADMDAIRTIAKKHGLFVIEDGAQAIGAKYKGEQAGTMGTVGCFSFFPSKNLGGAGDGGLVTTNDDELFSKLEKMRVHGMHPKYYHQYIGGNFRLDALQAVVLSVKLPHLNDWHEGRRANAAFYTKAFEKCEKIITPKEMAGNYMIFNQYIVRVPRRDEVIAGLKAAGIGCDIYYPVSLHMQECFKYLGYKSGAFPESEKAASETLALPIYAELTTEQKQYVADTLISLVEK
ncbi:DegT/DnrJ/EryC1/StrS family aminotransferase [bacterium]|nr:DegT/DnrJ/EryC1/StrS family aminotransferase [bacterium]MBR6463063.1 DegT/DnrJ/EryC1/StrS family aminotransferase [bacterium]